MASTMNFINNIRNVGFERYKIIKKDGIANEK